ncbi:MAG: DUF1974 domain-containing protein, partial [Spirochaetia bacterium]|nr:DUF1974 domain-containing protein [Spirochaetia bacterium]
LTHGEHRDRMTKGIYVSTDPKDALGRFENAFNLFVESQDVFGKITEAVRSKRLPRKRAEDLIREAQAAGVITKAEALLLEKEEAARLDAVQVDSYTLKDYLRYGKT